MTSSDAMSAQCPHADLTSNATVASRAAGPARAAGAGEPQDFSRPDEGRAAQQAQGAERRVRRLSQLRAGRRPAVHRLEHLRPARQAVPQDVPRRGGPALLRADRRQPVDGFRHADQAANTPSNWPRRWASSAWCAATACRSKRWASRPRNAAPVLRGRAERVADARLSGRRSSRRDRVAGRRASRTSACATPARESSC